MRLFLVVTLCFFGSLSAKVLIITHSYNRPDFIPLQYKTFKKFLKDDYEFVVFCDSPTHKGAAQIQEQCDKLGIRYIRIPQWIHRKPYLYRPDPKAWNDASVRTANVIQYSFDTLAFDHDDIVAVIDSDMFLIRDFSITEYMQGIDISAVYQCRGPERIISYLWNGIMFFNMSTLPNKRSLNFNCGDIEGYATDTGGYTHYYLRENPRARVLYMQDQLDLVEGRYFNISNRAQLGREGEYLREEEVLDSIPPQSPLAWLLQSKPDDIQFFLNFAFLHYRRAGNYHGKPPAYHQKKTEIISEFMERLLQ